MSFLSLATGDPAARNLLQKAIRARYGARPQAAESLRLWMTGRAKGPLGLPAASSVTLAFVAPARWRWDHEVKFLGLRLKQSSCRFNGEVYGERTGNVVTHISDEQAIQGIRCRLWGEIAALLTPLMARGVTLKALDKSSFQACLDSIPGSTVTIRLNEDGTVLAVESTCYHAADQPCVLLSIRPQGGLQTLDGFSVPKQIVYQWGNEPPEVFTVVKAEVNPRIPVEEFTL